MSHQAAVDLDVELVVLAPDADAPAVRAGASHLPGDPSSARDLARLASASDVITFDHERVSGAALGKLEAGGHLIRPGPEAKRLAQDKLAARRALSAAGLPVPDWARAPDAAAVGRFAKHHGWPVVLKARRGGYDGRGVWEVDSPSRAGEVFEALGTGAELLVEERVEIVRELAVIVVRRPSGESVTYPVMETTQRDGICRWVTAPAGCAPAVARRATALAERIATLTQASGIICVEMFEAASGLLVNELAMRPHNAGHLTLDAFGTSQFENHLRAILDLPLGPTAAIVPAAAMVNVLGSPDGSDPAARLDLALGVPGARVRLYGKQARPGRKLGHVTALAETSDEALARALEAALLLSDA